MSRKLALAILSAMAALLLPLGRASAVPAFAEQTGQPCATCHIGAFGPHLTPFGRQFKLSGYTLRAGAFTPPVSAVAIASFFHTAKDQPPPPQRHYDVNNNATIDYLLLFVSGGFGDHFGTLTDITYDGVNRNFHWDHLDFRAVDTTTLMGSDLVYGLDINNEPTGQDVFATLPIWGFPFTTSDLAPQVAGATQLSGKFAQNVIGASAYGWWNSEVYAEFGVYRSLSEGMLRFVGQNPDGANLIDGVAPYYRLAWQRDFGDQNVEIGTFGLFPSLFPGRDQSTGRTDDYSDVGVDASYEYLGSNENIATINLRYTHEDQNLNASKILGAATNSSDTLNEFNINGSYYWQNLVGVSVGHFQTWGNRDPLFYSGNRTFKPDTSGFIFQVDATPFRNKDDFPTRLNLRIGLQYIAYTKFNGAGSNFDGAGRNASDNNSIRLFLWGAL
jgi:hypothetical protein